MTALLQTDSASLVSPVNETKQPRYSTFPSASDNVDQTKQRLHDAQLTPGTAPLWSRLFFSYANPMMSAGNTRQLNNEDLWELEGENRSAAAFDEFVEHFERHDKSIIKAMVAAYGGRFLLCGLAMLFTTACNVFAPAVLNHVITVIVNAVVATHMRFYLELIALRLTVTLKALLFRKAMRRSIQSKGDAKAVDISNLYSSDVNNVLFAAFQINSLWIIPIQIVVVVYMLYAVIDMAAFAGLAVIALFMLASFIIAKLSGSTFEDIMKHKDERMKTIKEVFNAIQIVKLNAWEDKFADKIHKLRATELSAVKRFMYLGALNIFVLWGSPLAVSTVSFAVYGITMGKVLTAAKVFTAIALFNALRDPLRDLPTVIQTCIQAKISINRFSDYLSLDEFQPTNVTRDDSSQPEDVVMAIEDGTFGWTKDTALLSKVNLTIKRGDLVIVHGSVGSGKSSLCSALLGEMDKLAGSVFYLFALMVMSHDGENQPVKDIDVGRLIDDEEREEGRVSKEVFSNYFESLGGMKVCIFLFVVQTLWQVCQIGSDLWLSHWTGQKDGSYNPDETATTSSCCWLRPRALFDNMTLSLLKAPLRFFDANPIGRIVNRYGDDMSAVDFMIPFAYGSFLAMFFFTVCQLATAVYTMNFLGALIIPLVWMYVKIANFYLAPSREISRLWKVSSSPVLSHVEQSEEGVVVIRAFGLDTVGRMINENFIRNDVNSRCWFSETVTQQWFQVRMQLIGSGVIFVVVSGLVYLRDYLSPVWWD
ncbi:ABC transporter C family member 2 [Phytophthora ramorum]|uniref:ABC transporter C family member 2 n=1 Tax=Phytophthora ramorum TaxID=164328 RepID=UPI0030A68A26|nr:ABC transporter C family member 2 [Phytophthora ramorum]